MPSTVLCRGVAGGAVLPGVDTWGQLGCKARNACPLVNSDMTRPNASGLLGCCWGSWSQAPACSVVCSWSLQLAVPSTL